MSRTFKDIPYWVVASNPMYWRGEAHDCVSRHHECDIDTQMTASHHWSWCERILDDRHPAVRRWKQPRRLYAPDSRRRRDEYWVPERAHVRERLGRALRSSRYGLPEEFDDSTPVVEQHRHTPFGGYW